MIQSVLDYTWARNQILNSIAEAQLDSTFVTEDNPILSRADNLSSRVVECISADPYDCYKANILKAREVAYWNEWLNDAIGDGVICDMSVNAIRAAIASFAALEL